MSDAPIPLGTIDPGTTVVVGSADLDRAQTLGTLLLAMGCERDDGLLFVSTDTDGSELLDQCVRFDLDLGSVDTQLIDGTGAATDLGEDVGVQSLSPDDLTGMGISFSVVYENLSTAGCRRILAGMHTLTSLLEQYDLRDVVRLLNTVTGRVRDGDGLMVFVIDSTAHPTETIKTLGQVCDGYIEARTAGDGEGAGYEIRVHGLPDQPEGWLPVPGSLLERADAD